MSIVRCAYYCNGSCSRVVVRADWPKREEDVRCRCACPFQKTFYRIQEEERQRRGRGGNPTINSKITEAVSETERLQHFLPSLRGAGKPGRRREGCAGPGLRLPPAALELFPVWPLGAPRLLRPPLGDVGGRLLRLLLQNFESSMCRLWPASSGHCLPCPEQILAPRLRSLYGLQADHQ